MGTSPMSPEGDDVDSREVKTVDPREAALQKVMQEHGQIEAYGKGGYVDEKYNYVYSEYKRGVEVLGPGRWKGGEGES